MRRITRWLAAAGATSILVLPLAGPAGAAVPGPRNEQWWFGVWEIEKKVWPISKGAGVTVAVIDSGVNASLPDLRDAVVPGKSFPTISGSEDGRTDTDPDNGGHGTRMAALIASRGTSTGFVGLAPEAKILPINAPYPGMADGIRYAADQGARVINISQAYAEPGGKCSDEMQRAVGYALEKDVVIVAGAGNDGNEANEPMAPAMCAGVLAAGALDVNKQPWAETQRQPYVSVAAPGYMVGSLSRDGTFDTRRVGTSQASALTSAVVAIMRSKHPQMPAREVVQRIINTARDVGPRGKDDQSGYGAVIPAAALTADVPKNAPNPVFAAYDKWAAAAGPEQQQQQPGTAPGKSEPAPKSEKTKAGEQSQRNTLLLLGGVGVVAVIGLVVLVLVLRRGRKGTPAAGAVPMQPGGPLGPPPGWGGPAQGPYAGQQNPQQYTPPTGPPGGPPGGPQPPYGPR